MLVLGGTGFVGSEICQRLLRTGYLPVTVSRRGRVEDADITSVEPSMQCIRGDLVQEKQLVARLLAEVGPFIGVIHCVGMLLPNSLNALASGSGSVPSEGTTYDEITRQTACNAADALAAALPGAPFIFVSAAEAGWSADPPLLPGFMQKYLTAKRAVEQHLDMLSQTGGIRAVVLRPSLVWTPNRPAAVPPVAAFTIGSVLGIPGIDKPVRVETLAEAAVAALMDESASGLWSYREMERAARKF